MKIQTWFVVVCLLAVTTGCGRVADTVTPAAERAARELPQPPTVRVKVPTPRVEPPAADRSAITRRAVDLVRTIPFPDGQQRRAVIHIGCTLHTAYEMSQLPNEAELTRKAVLEAGGNRTIGLRAVEFVEELRSSQWQDNIGQLAIASVCGI